MPESPPTRSDDSAGDLPDRRASDAPETPDRSGIEVLVERARHAVAAREQERRRLAAELHDGPGTNLAAIKLNLSMLARAIPAAAHEEAALLHDTQALLTDTILGIRDLCSALRPAVLDYAGLVEAIATHCTRFSRRTGLGVELDLVQYDQRCTPEIELMLLRVTQEALWNCAKHSNATRVRISFRCGEDGRVFAIEDDGCGFDPAGLGAPGRATGIGILTMRERALGNGANFRLQSAPGEGTRIVLEF